jgi:regulator of protease activity HflC (stomatin/prohibitin superfamily)
MSHVIDRLEAGEERARSAFRRNDLKIVLFLLFVVFLFIFYWNNIVISIHSGEEGVLWSRIFGTRVNTVYPEGTHLILPIDQMTIYDVRYQKVDRTVTVMSKDGLDIKVDMSIRYKPMEKLIGRLHQLVGPNYVETIVVPEVITAVRTVIGRYRPEELYTTSFQQIEDDIVKLATVQVRERYILLDDVLIKDVQLPPAVASAIQRKLEQEQAALEMQFRIQREEQEARRKEIEANGIKAFQDIVSSSLTDRILQYQGIQATLELAKSNNAKIVIVGGGKNGLPIILGADALAAAAPAGQARATTPAKPAETAKK